MTLEQMVAAQVPWWAVGCMAAFLIGCVTGWYARHSVKS